jgi:hypothetical protein
MLMTRGVVSIRNSPSRLVGTIRRYRHPVTNTTVTLKPIPTLSTPSTFRKLFYDHIADPNTHIVLCEDGRLPFLAGSAPAIIQRVFKTFLPFLAYRPVVTDASKFDGIIGRDAVDSRIAYQSVVAQKDTTTCTVDPRARRAVERILSYPAGSHVVATFNVYHTVYFWHRLPELGFVLDSTEEIEIARMSHFVAFLILCSLFLSLTVATFIRGIVGF